MNLKSLKIGQSVVAEDSKLSLDVHEEVDHKGKWGWEITDNKGEVIDQKYGFTSDKLAEKAGKDQLKKFKVDSHVVTAKNVFDVAEKGASQGHYLERLVALCSAFGMKDTAVMVKAVAKYVLSSHKPQWIDGLVYDISSSIIYHAKQLHPKPEDWAKIVWGLDHEALKEEDLLKYRERNADPAKRENH